MRVVSRARIWGSSPLTRGKPRVGPAAGFGLGLIPAHAGKTDPRVGQAVEVRAHPRSRGENIEDVRVVPTE